MKTYKINNKQYTLRDFTFAEQTKINEFKILLAPELFGGKASVNIAPTNEQLLGIVNFILEDEIGNRAVLTPADLENTGVKEFSSLIIDFITAELQYTAEKKRFSMNLIKELKELQPK